jgi:hypothetical protein
MENLPFLSKSNEPPSRSAPLQESEIPRDVWTPTHEFEEPQQRRFVPMYEPPKKNVFDSLKDNQMALVLLGIVIGVIIMNMRPIIVNPK